VGEAEGVGALSLHRFASFLPALHPSGDDLFQATRPDIDDAMLRHVARLDYGFDVDRHFEALCELRDGLPGSGTGWYPHEVVSLMHWSKRPNEMDDEQYHRLRLFACGALLDPDRFTDHDPDGTIAIAVDSIRALGGEHGGPMLSTLAAIVERISEDDGERCLPVLLGMLMTVCVIPAGKVPPGDIVAEIVHAADVCAKSDRFWSHRRLADGGQLSGPFDARRWMMAELWTELARTVLMVPPDHLPDTLRDGLCRVGRAMCPPNETRPSGWKRRGE